MIRKSGADQGLTGNLDQVFSLHQREQVPGGGGGNGISQIEVLQHQNIAGTQGRKAERRGLLLAAAEGGSWVAIGKTAENPTPTGKPQRRNKDARQSRRLARSLTRREDWPRDPVGVGVGVRRAWRRLTAPQCNRQGYVSFS